MSNKNTETVYADRNELDAQLNGAIAEILSAEEEAKHIIAQAEASVKAIQLDGATREREMRELSTKKIAADRDAALKAAAEKAQAECDKRLAEAHSVAQDAVKSNMKRISAIADKLYRSLGGDK